MSTKSRTGLTNPSLPPIPTRLGRYDVVERLATGGMAEIFLAIERSDHGLERTVVVKRILPHLAIHEKFVEMFLQEARIVARLNHPNIVQIYELGESDGSFYIAMEYVPGCSLRDLMRKAALHQVEFPTDVACSIMRAACAGAHAAHELKDPEGNPLGLVHRDISPHNLMVTAEGHVKLLDFGIAKATEVAESHTKTGALKGKVHYMSPEQCRQSDLDRRSDEFALGIVFWELLTARRLFKRESELMSMQAIVAGEIWPATQFRDDLPDDVALVIERSLATERDDRYDTCDEMRRAIDDVARSNDLRLGQDAIATFVNDVMGDTLRKEQEAHQEAIEHTMTIGMVDTQILDDDDEGDATVVEGRTGAGFKKKNSETAPSMPSLPGLDARALVDATPPRRSRAAQLVGVFVVFALLTLGGYAWVKHRPVSGPPIVIGLAPIVDPATLLDDMEGLREYLELATRRPIQFLVAEDYRSLSDQLVDGRLHFASLPPLLFVKTQARSPKVRAVAIKLIDGSPGSDALLLARGDSDITSVQAAKGKTMCLSDVDSTTGYALPRAHLKKMGLDPDTDVIPRLTGTHSQTLRDLIDGKCDIGGTYSGAYLSAQAAGIPVSRLRQLGIVGRVPQDTIAASPKTSAKDFKLLEKALLKFDAQKALGRATVGAVERVSGYQSPRDDDFKDVRALLPAAKSDHK